MAIAPPPPPRAAPGNPSVRLDPGLGLVVLEFHSASGAITSTIPSAQQIAAYRRWQAATLGEAGAAGQPGPPMPGAGGPAFSVTAPGPPAAPVPGRKT